MKTKSVLLIEDDPFIADIYLTKLKAGGFEADLARDGEEALKKIKERKPDLLLLDIILPNLDGWELLRKIRQKPAYKGMRVVILSNLEQRAEVEKGLKLGADRYLVKAHYTPSEVIEEVKKIIEKR